MAFFPSFGLKESLVFIFRVLRSKLALTFWNFLLCHRRRQCGAAAQATSCRGPGSTCDQSFSPAIPDPSAWVAAARMVCSAAGQHSGALSSHDASSAAAPWPSRASGASSAARPEAKTVLSDLEHQPVATLLHASPPRAQRAPCRSGATPRSASVRIERGPGSCA